MNTVSYGARRPAGRPAALLATIALHAAGIAILASTAGFQRIVDSTPHTIAVLLDTAKPDREPPPKIDYVPSSAPRVENVAMVVVPQPLVIDDGAPAGDSVAAVTGSEAIAGAGRGAEVAPVAAPVSTPLGWTARRSPDEMYPPASIRMEEQGVATVRVCVGADGRVAGMPQVTESTGHPRLDAAAVAWTREAVVYRPATEDGRAVTACRGFKLTFHLR